MVRYTLEITHGGRFVADADRDRAYAAIDAALAVEGITTDDQWRAALLAYVARTECKPHDAARADTYERIRSTGDIALTLGWHNPDGASLELGMA